MYVIYLGYMRNVYNLIQGICVMYIIYIGFMCNVYNIYRVDV